MSWQPIARIEAEYSRAVQRFIDQIFREIDPTMSASQWAQLVTSDRFYQLALGMASRMVTGIRVDRARSWREAASQSMRGREIYQALRSEMQGPIGQFVNAQIQRNAELIQSAPLEVSQRIVSFIQHEQIRGRRAEDIMNDLRAKVPSLTRNEAMLIARTEVSKATTALTRAQAYEMDLPYYIWRTSKDSRVRSSHKHMEGVIVKWTDPPSPENLNHEKYFYGHYHAGEIFNCRCYPEPILDFNDLPNSVKYYSGGQIHRMTKSQFIKMAA